MYLLAPATRCVESHRIKLRTAPFLIVPNITRNKGYEMYINLRQRKLSAVVFVRNINLLEIRDQNHY